MRIGVTGAGGFLGRAILRASSDDSVMTFASDRSQPDAPWSAASLDGLDALVHVAAAGTRGGTRTWDACVGPNVAGCLALVRAAIAAGVPRIVTIGTMMEYGGRGSLPGSVLDDAQPYLETERCEPREPYGATKLAGAELALTAAREAGVALVHLRLCALYGPDGPEGDLFTSLLNLASEGGTLDVSPGAQVREWLHVDDAAAAVRAALEGPATVSIVNVSSGQPLSVGELIVRVVEIGGGSADQINLGGRLYRDGEPYYLALNIERALSLLGWAPSIRLEQGVAGLLR